MNSVEFIADVTPDGKIVHPDYVLQWLEKREEVYVKISVVTKKISDLQRALYFGWDIPQILQFETNRTGEYGTKDDVHLFHVQHILKPKFHSKTVFGKTVIVFEDNSVSKMSSFEFIEFRKKYVLHWAEKGLEIQDPPDKFKNHPLFKA